MLLVLILINMRKSGRSFTVSGSLFPTENLNVGYPEDLPDTEDAISFNDLVERLKNADGKELVVLRKIIAALQIEQKGRPLSSIEVKRTEGGKVYYYEVHFDPKQRKKVGVYVNDKYRPELIHALDSFFKLRRTQ